MVSKVVRIAVPVVVFWCVATLFVICILSVHYDKSSLIWYDYKFFIDPLSNGDGDVINLQNILTYSCVLFFVYGVSFAYVARDW
jgi:hypothetical protein